MIANEGLLGNSTGNPHGIALDAANEAVQILGQIVVDRASAEAFRLLQERLEALLACKDTAVTTGATFPATCKAISSARVQDLAMAPQVLMTALLEDMTWQILPKIGSTLEERTLKDEEKKLKEAKRIFEFVRRDVSPQLANSVQRLTPTTATLLASRMRSDGAQVLESQQATLCEQKTDSDKAKASLAFASAAVGACFLQNDYDSPAVCPIAPVVTKIYADTCPKGTADVRDMATKLALELLTALTATGDKSKPDVSARLHAGTNALFDYICAGLDFGNECVVTTDKMDSKADIKIDLTDLHAVYDAVIDRNGLQVAVKIAALFDHVFASTPAETKERHKRAFRLLAAVADYTLTFDPAQAGTSSASDGDSNAQTLHDKRTKILESLTSDMTDRTGRLDESIVSLGGALRATGGWWFRSGGDGAFLGPVSLPLGVGYDIYTGNKAHGFHLEAMALDLARYLSYQDGGTVNDVKITDAFAPSLGLAYFWGASMPVTLGLNLYYSPQHQFKDAAKYAVGGAISLGIYVPLLDLN